MSLAARVEGVRSLDRERFRVRRPGQLESHILPPERSEHLALHLQAQLAEPFARDNIVFCAEFVGEFLEDLATVHRMHSKPCSGQAGCDPSSPSKVCRCSAVSACCTSLRS